MEDKLGKPAIALSSRNSSTTQIEMDVLPSRSTSRTSRISENNKEKKTTETSEPVEDVAALVEIPEEPEYPDGGRLAIIMVSLSISIFLMALVGFVLIEAPEWSELTLT